MISLTANGKYGKTVCTADLSLNEDNSFSLIYEGKIYYRSASMEIDAIFSEEKTSVTNEIFKGTWKEDEDNIYLQVSKAEILKEDGGVMEDERNNKRVFILEKNDCDSYVVQDFISDMSTLEFFEENNYEMI